MTTGIAGQLSLYDLLDQPARPDPADAPPPPVPLSGSTEPDAPAPASGATAADDPASVSGSTEPDAPAPDGPGTDGSAATSGLAASVDDVETIGAHPVDGPPPLDVEVTRSKRRRKTAQARLVGSVLEIRIPAGCSQAEERSFVDHFRSKFERSQAAAMIDLARRAGELAARHDLPEPTTIRWVSNQQRQWGSCTPSDRSIRLSDRLAGFPGWVVDYVIVHELAHLVEADHGPAFWKLVNRYPKAERARGYLMAKDGI